MEKNEFKKIVEKATRKKAFNDLIEMKSKHSKMKNLHYKELKMQQYFSSDNNDITPQDVIGIFKLRTRMTEVKSNYKNNNESLECEICFENNETQEHILSCPWLGKACDIEYNELWNGIVSVKKEIATEFKNKMIKKQSIIQK